MIAKAIRWLAVVLGTAAVACTLLPFIPSNEWWIRVWDFPRIQLAALLAVALAAMALTGSLRRWPTLLSIAVLAAALAWQLYRILPYTPVHAVAASKTTDCEEDSRLRLLVANVLFGNHDEEPLLSLVRRVGPDVVLLVETGSWWHRHLEPLRDDYPHTVARPQDNGYGMHLFSRFALLDPEVRYLIDDYVPSIKTGLRLPSGTRVDLHGVHPKPPPIQDTARRDAELIVVGREVRDEPHPAIVAGDLNDVAWSHTTHLFQEVSGLLDPRVGRGPYSTFNANWPLLRWPLDHVFFEESFWLMEVAVLGDIGSDHFPFFVALCHDPGAALAQDEPDADPSTREEAEEAIGEGREEAQE